MKILTLLLMLVLVTAGTSAQNIRPSQAKQHVGDKVTVCGIVTGTSVVKGNPETTILSLGEEKSKAVVSIAIWSTDYPKFEYVPSEHLKGKNICVSGWMKLAGGQPQVIISSGEQVTISKE
jgi:hypothetical protein